MKYFSKVAYALSLFFIFTHSIYADSQSESSRLQLAGQLSQPPCVVEGLNQTINFGMLTRRDDSTGRVAFLRFHHCPKQQKISIQGNDAQSDGDVDFKNEHNPQQKLKFRLFLPYDITDDDNPWQGPSGRNKLRTRDISGAKEGNLFKNGEDIDNFTHQVTSSPTTVTTGKKRSIHVPIRVEMKLTEGSQLGPFSRIALLSISYP